MTLQKQIDDLLAQRASQWVDVLRKGSTDDFAAFVAWVGESPRNLDEFLTVAALDRELQTQELYVGFDREALLKRIAPPPVAQLQRPRTPPPYPPPATGGGERARSRFKRWRMGALAAGIALMGLLGFMARHAWAPSQEFKTGIGELRSLELPDGSLVYLNAQSFLKVDFSKAARNIDLTEGEALFKVVRDPGRTFQVRTRNAIVKALGTQFNVSSRESGTRVAVLEGRVQVSAVANAAGKAAALNVGEAAQIAPKGYVQVTPRADVKSAVAWRERRLVFAKASLEEITGEFNRFNRKRLRLEAVQPGTRHYSGTFDADDPEALIAFLAREHDLAIEQNADEIVIRER
jgi:transmembrane sensor